MLEASFVLRRVARVSLLTLIACLLFVPTADAAFPGNNGKIVFSRCTFDPNDLPPIYTDCDIFTANADGSNEQDLNQGESPVAQDFNPSWSPDGTKIAFVSTRNGSTGPDIYLMNADGSNQTPLALADKSGDQGSPAWSPAGTRLAFATDDGTAPYTSNDVHTANVDGTNRAVLTASPADDATPAWSPDGTKIAFRSQRVPPGETQGYWAIYTLDPDDQDDSSLQKVTDNGVPLYDQEPNWSPDGKKLLFQTDPAGRYDIFTINVPSEGEGTGQTNLISPANDADDVQGAWSPNGTQIVFGSNRGVGGGPAKLDSDIWKFNANGSNPVRVTNDGAENTSDIDPDWQRVPYAYPRPGGASPVKVSLVTAFGQCSTYTGPQHNAPLAYPVCLGPAHESPNLTVGTPDFNGQSPSFSGSVEVKVINTLLPTQDDQYTVNMTDVRCAGGTGGCSGGALTDYSGEMQVVTTMRITDKNTFPLNSAATLIDIPFSFGVPCSVTGAPGLPNSVGSTCSVVTTANTLVPGFVTFGKRQVVELGQIRVFDGGSDGSASTSGNSLFAVQGVFNP